MHVGSSKRSAFMEDQSWVRQHFGESEQHNLSKPKHIEKCIPLNSVSRISEIDLYQFFWSDLSALINPSIEIQTLCFSHKWIYAIFNEKIQKYVCVILKVTQ